MQPVAQEHRARFHTSLKPSNPRVPNNLYPRAIVVDFICLLGALGHASSVGGGKVLRLALLAVLLRY